MSRVCELTGKGPMVGNNVSHANNKTKRRFLPNLNDVSLMSETLGRTFKLRISASALRTVDQSSPTVDDRRSSIITSHHCPARGP